MNVLPFEKQIAVIAALVEGNSIRSVERLTGIHRDTIMRLGVRIGTGCARLHDSRMHSLHVSRLELDEIWSYVGKKQRKITATDSADLGDQYTFIALDATGKGIVSYRVGKRNQANTQAFLFDVRERVLGRPEISTDGWNAYEGAVEDAFGIECSYGQIVKQYAGEPAIDAARRYSPGYVVAVGRRAVVGAPRQISTSYVERSNLSLRMGNRRFTRLTNGFSKKLENHAAAVGLYVAHYNFCRVSEATRITPALALGVADHVWSIGELVEAATAQMDRPEAVRRYGSFRVIDGGKGESK